MEDIAHELGRDPLEFKRQNWVKLGDELNIAPHIGERATDGDLELDEYPRVHVVGHRGVCGPGPALDRLASPTRPGMA